MNDKNEVLLLIGSPRGTNSTSESLGMYLCNRLDKEKFNINKGYTHRLVLREEKYNKFCDMIEKSDLIILSFPLYVDHLPAPLIKVLEILDENKDKIKNLSQKSLIAISNSGFPESSQIDLAMKICKNFANEMEFQWKGELQFGGGEVIHGRDLEDVGKITENLKKGLKMAAKEISSGSLISQEAKDFVSQKTVPKGMFKLFANLGWRFRAMKNWNFFNLKNTPYS